MDFNSTTFGAVAEEAARLYSGKPAIVMDGQSQSFAQIDERMNRAANGLGALGLKRGDRVAILSRNRPEIIEIYGASRAGLIVLPLNFRLAPQELLHPLTDAEPAALIVDPSFAPAIDQLRSQLPSVRLFVRFGPAGDGWLNYEDLLAAASPSRPDVRVVPDDILCLMYTSGTTGRPKGAMLSHGALMRNCRAAADWTLGLAETDVSLAVMPLFHVGGLWYHFFPGYSRGCTTILMPEFSVESVLDTMQKHRVTFAHFVPTMINALVNHPAARTTDLSALRIVYYGASSIPVDLLKRAMDIFGHCDFLQGYGSTEAGMVTLLAAQDHRDALAGTGAAARLGSAGKALHCEIKIADSDKTGIGEIAVRGDRMMAGYWRNPAATQQAMPDGWLRTGDLGILDADGYLTIADRKHDMIVSGGENVYPREVEDALYQEPAILEAAVFGLPDPHWVQQVAAAIVLRPGVTVSSDDLQASLRTRLAGYKCPKTIFFCDSLPKSGAGKVLKKELRRIYAPAGTAS